MRCSRRLFIILVSLTMTWFSEKIVISTRCIHNFMSNLIKKSWTDSKLAVASLLAWLVCGPNKKFLPNYDGGNIISLAKWLLQFFLYGDLFAWRGFLHTKIHLECAIYFLFANSEFANQENRESIPIKFIVDQLIMGLFVFKTIKLSNCTICLWFILYFLFCCLKLLNMIGNICN